MQALGVPGIRHFVAMAIMGFAIVLGAAGDAVAAPKAAVVMDMRNGKVLYARSADRKLHPASLTKMMTLYLTFEAVRTGQLKLDQKVVVSRKAARQPASKLYLKAGSRVTIRSMIRATAIKSANDAAMVLAEAIAGSQEEFGRLMTRTARRLGMKNSAFRNPHGLTQSGHYSTARDMALMGRHLFFEYPQYYNIFKRRTDYAAGKRVWTTNRLLSTYPGADGIKTGYTSAAGYNLVASAHRGSKRILAVQFGASSSKDRARRVKKLLDLGFKRAKNSVTRVPPRVARTQVAQADWSPVPLRRPAAPPGALATLQSAIVPQAAAATRPERRIVSSVLAPETAEMPRRRLVVAPSPQTQSPPLRNVSGFPIPVPRPGATVVSSDAKWTAAIGPYDTEETALAALAELPGSPQGQEGVRVARSSDTPGAYVLRMEGLSQQRALGVCTEAFVTGAVCRVTQAQG